MKRFTQLYAELDATTKTTRKVAAMEQYFRAAPAGDAAWATYLLRGGKLRAPFPARVLREWAADAAGLPPWLVDECYEQVGDLAETIALVLPESQSASGVGSLQEWVEGRVAPLRGLPPESQRASVVDSWTQLSAAQRMVWNKLITGSFRVGVSDGLVIRAVAAATGQPVEVIAHRLAGDWLPSAAAWTALTSPAVSGERESQPYPFYLSSPLVGDPRNLGAIDRWLIEYKWDGIRAQAIRRQTATYIWSRGGEHLADRFPDLVQFLQRVPPGTVLDGEIVGWRDGRVLPFADLQQRITRKSVSKAFLAKIPVHMLAFDVLEWQGQDIRARPLTERRAILDRLDVGRSERCVVGGWDAAAAARATARDHRAEGVMLKHLESSYGVGRERGQWWKWKLDPYTLDAVLIGAQRGHGRRAGLYTDYTFGLWREGQLVPFAKAYSGLTDAEFRDVDRFIRQHTRERFGPVCSVDPELVFEIAFEGIQRSSRHKSGVAVRFPRMSRWRTDKQAADADQLSTLEALLTV